jgi:hypothetical protein
MYIGLFQGSVCRIMALYISESAGFFFVLFYPQLFLPLSCIHLRPSRQCSCPGIPNLGSLMTAAPLFPWNPGPHTCTSAELTLIVTCEVHSNIVTYTLPGPHSCFAFASVVRGCVCSPPHSAGRVPGDNTGTAERAALPRNHPLL